MTNPTTETGNVLVDLNAKAQAFTAADLANKRAEFKADQRGGTVLATYMGDDLLRLHMLYTAAATAVLAARSEHNVFHGTEGRSALGRRGREKRHAEILGRLRVATAHLGIAKELLTAQAIASFPVLADKAIFFGKGGSIGYLEDDGLSGIFGGLDDMPEALKAFLAEGGPFGDLDGVEVVFMSGDGSEGGPFGGRGGFGGIDISSLLSRFRRRTNA